MFGHGTEVITSTERPEVMEATNIILSTYVAVFFTVTDVCFGIVIVCSNVFVLAVIIKSDLCLRKHNAFILQLLLCDVLRGAVTMAIAVDRIVHENSGSGGCPAWGFLLTLATSVNLMAVPLLLYDRVLYVTGPVNYMYRVTGKVISFLIAYNFLQATIVATLPLIGWGSYTYQDQYRLCEASADSPVAYFIFVFVLVYFIPLAISYACYIKLHIAFKSRLCQVKTFNPGTLTPLPYSQTGADSKSYPPTHMDFSIRSTAKTLMVLFAVYVISWTPFAIFKFVTSFGISSVRRVTLAYYLLHSLTLVTSGVNPWLYGWYNKRFRSTMRTFYNQCNPFGRRETAVSELPVPTRPRSISLMALHEYPIGDDTDAMGDNKRMSMAELDSIHTSVVELRLPGDTIV